MPTQQADHKIGQLSIAFEMLSPCETIENQGTIGQAILSSHFYTISPSNKLIQNRCIPVVPVQNSAIAALVGCVNEV